MTNTHTETIAAIATPPGKGGVGIIRISGKDSLNIAKNISGLTAIKNRYANYCDFKDQDQQTIDSGLLIYFKGPNSFTGEDVVELQGHGGPVILQMLLKQVLELGGRAAKPGEFSERAFLNDKIDLAQAEAIADVINSSSEAAAKSAMRSLQGDFSNQINQLLHELINTRMYVESAIDFPEEEIDFITQGRVAEKIGNNQTALNLIFEKAKQGVLLRDGIQVVLVGQPNVGKSSLMNALAGEEVAIVTPIAGTTRDAIKSAIQINGVPLHVVDTAGLRDTDDEVEKIGISRTYRATESANIALILVDSTHGIGKEEKSILDRLPQEITKIWVHNKIDVSNEASSELEKAGESHIYLSAKTGQGLDLLKNKLLDLVGYQSSGEGVFMARARHLKALDAVKQHLETAQAQINNPELVAEELRLAQEYLSMITGEFTPDDLLGEIFSKFCIGK